VQKYEGVGYAPGLKEAHKPGEAGAQTTANTAASIPVEYYYGLGAILAALGAILVAATAGTILAIKKTKS